MLSEFCLNCGVFSGLLFAFVSLWHLKQAVCHTVALPFTLKRILRQKKNYGNSNISPRKNIIFQKSSKKNQNPSKYYNQSQVSTQAKISCFKNPHIKINLLIT
jgi:hypothetical protein